MEVPLAITQALLKLDSILMTLSEEIVKSLKDKIQMRLVRIKKRVEDFLCQMERVHDDIYFRNIVGVDGLIYTTSYSKELGFNTCYIHSIIKYFDDWVVVNMDMSDRYCNIVFDTSIGNY